jgi:hypothetical protein
MDTDDDAMIQHIAEQDINGVPIDPDNGVIKDEPYSEVEWSSQEEAEFYGDTLVKLITAGLELHSYVPSGREITGRDYVGKDKAIVDVYNAALQMRMIIDAKMSAAGEARREKL